MNIYKKQYFKYKNKYLKLKYGSGKKNLSKQTRKKKNEKSKHIIPISSIIKKKDPTIKNPVKQKLEHGIIYNIKKFINILETGKILSAKAAIDTKNTDFVNSHANSTNKGMCVSTSKPNSLCSNKYSVPGITFIIDINEKMKLNNFKGAQDGEVHVEYSIPLVHVKEIYINPKLQDIKMSDLKLDICNIHFGSADIKEKLKYMFPSYTETTIKKLELIYDKQIKLAEKDIIDNKIVELNKRWSTKDYYLEKFTKACSDRYLKVLNEQIKTIDIFNLTLKNFIIFLIEKYGYNIKIVNNLPNR
jgi:hypothetical protein